MIKNKILFFSPIFHPDIGGPAVQGSYLVELLIDNDFNVTVVKYKKNKLENQNRKFNLIYLKFSSDPIKIVRLFRWLISPFIAIFLILKVKPNLYISNTVSLQGMVTGLIAKLMGIPTIIKFTGDWVFESTSGDKDSKVNYVNIYNRNYLSKILFFIEKFMLTRFDLIWVISEYRKRNAMDIGIEESKIWIQRNFHELPVINRSEDKANELVIITASRLVDHKRLDQVLKSIRNLENINWKFIICGDGPAKNSLMKLSKELNIENNVFFTGIISRNLLFYLMSHSDVYLSWSSEEGAPNVFIEALNFGLPVISADVGGVSEMISDGLDGLLLDANQPELIPASILHLSERDKLRFFSNNATKTAKLYSLNENGPVFIKKIKEIIKRES